MSSKPNKAKSHSVFRTITLPFLGLLTIELGILLSVLFFSGMLGQLNRNMEDILEKQVENRKNDLENTMLSDWADLSRLSRSINTKTQKMLSLGEISLEDMESNPEKCSHLLLDITDDLIDELYSKRVNGVYVLFTRTDAPFTHSGNSPLTRNGLYIRDLDPDSTPSAINADLLLKRGPSAVIRANTVSTDSDWMPMFAFSESEPPTRYDFLSQPFQAAYHTSEVDDPTDFGFWSLDSSSWADGSYTSVTYSQPLVLDNGTVYGVVGVEILHEYLRSLLPNEELSYNENAFYMLAKVDQSNPDSQSIQIDSHLIGSTIPGQQIPSVPTSLLPSPSKENTYTAMIGDSKYHCSGIPLPLYSINTPFESQQWMLLGLVKEETLYANTRRIEFFLGVSIFLAFLTGFFGSILIGRKFSLPIQKLSGEVMAAQYGNAEAIPQLSQTGITEIDNFATAITNLSHSILDTSTRFLRIIDMASVEIAGFELRRNENAFVTDNFFSMLDLQVDHPGELSARDFKELLEAMGQTLPHTQRQDGSIVYEVVRPGSGIHYIRVSVTQMDDRMVGLSEDITELTLESKRIEHERDYDLLTGLLNRRAFQREAEKKFQQQNISHAALIMLDLDNLKSTNDKYGHEWGDQYIQQAAHGFAAATPPNSLLGRLSGDEFAVFMWGYASIEEAQAASKQFEAAIRPNTFLSPNGEPHPIHVSGGVAWYPESSANFIELLKYADFAMYQVKHKGKGYIGEFDPTIYNEESYHAQNLREFMEVLKNGYLEYHFQPIFSAKDGSIFAYEALMRVNTPTLRTPDALLNLARSENKLQEIECMSMVNSATHYRSLLQDELVDPNAYLFINSIGNQSMDDDTIAEFRNICRDFQDHVVIELTESSDIDPETLRRKQNADCFSGMFALDDYGSGYNSEKNLLTVSPRFVKVDMSIITGIDIDINKQSIVSNLLSYAHKRDMLVVAEGLETFSEISKCLELGVDLLQGFALARPAQKPLAIQPTALKIIQDFHCTQNQKQD